MAKVIKFGMFGGVFTPSILTILGVIMYLRLPMIVGEAGLWATIGIIILAHIISVTTGLSVSSIATDKKVEAGGTYFMISRSLGLPIGGTLGLALFVGLSFSVSLYLIGFAESFLSYCGYEITINTIRLAGTIILVVVTTITFISTSLAIKTQYFIMVAIVLSLISILAGNHDFGPQASTSLQALESSSKVLPFMLLFGIFFPAVTGFEAGVSMSGDLKDPKKSIPTGSIMAILVGLVVYIGLAFFFALTVDAKTLATDSQVLLKISWIPELVIAGIWGATLSSALGSILGAPRILQATAVDKISPRFFGKGVGTANEPRNALLLTFIIAEAGILIGNLDVIARIVSIFFITTYGFLNLSCAIERWTSADFRPTFKTPIWVSLLGATACFIVMIQLDFLASLGATIILGALYLFLKRKELALQSGDTWAGVWSSLAKAALQRLTIEKVHNRNWRPNILMFNGTDSARPFMSALGKAISGKLGLLSSFELIPSKDFSLKPQGKNETESGTIFKKTYTCNNLYDGIDEIARVYGYTGVEPNTVLMGWTKKAENKDAFLKLMDNIQRYNLNGLFLFHSAAEKKLLTPTIDIWWSGWGRNLSLALNILKHLTANDPWNRASTRLCIILNKGEDHDRINRTIKNILSQYRTNIKIKLIDNHITQQARHRIISAESANTDLAIIGIPNFSYDDLPTAYSYANAISDQLYSALYINASDQFEDFTVLTESTTSEASSADKNEWVLPDLAASKYSEIENDCKKIDERGHQLVNALHKKIITAALVPESALADKISVLAGSTISTLRKVAAYQEPFQRHEALLRAKKYFNSQIVNLVEHSLIQTIPQQKELLHDGMQWYMEKLDVDVAAFPKYTKIAYEKADFAPRIGEAPALRWLKFKKNLLHPFSKKTISITLNYREGADYFFRDLRIEFLSLLVSKIKESLSSLREKSRQFIVWTDESFQNLANESSPTSQEQQIEDFIAQLKVRSSDLIAVINDLKNISKGRLQLEYRKSINFFIHQLERVDFNRAMRAKRRSKKFYESKKQALLAFSDAWSEQAIIELNTTKTVVILQDYTGSVKHEVSTYLNRLKQFLINDQQQPVTLLVGQLNSLAGQSNETKQATISKWRFDYHKASGMLDETTNKLLAYANLLPEENIVEDQSGLERGSKALPLKAMVSYLTETIVAGPANDLVEVLEEKRKQTNLAIIDIASLTIFNVFNLKEDDQAEQRTEEIRLAIQSINQEMENLQQATETILKNIEKQANEFHNSLKLHQLSDISSGFSTMVRKQRNTKLQTTISLKLNQLLVSIKTALVYVLYSQTKGVLLSRKLSDSNQLLSVNERIRYLISSSTANQRLLQKLPHYYASLFSGRSSIGDNFWVARPVEKKQLQLAYSHYLINQEGFILILGQRNSGKTLLCKQFGEEKSPEATYHLFSPEAGSITIEAFDAALQRATKFEGDSSQLINLLPHNSMIVIHDLELWWERGEENGLAVIRHIKLLVEQFSSKCLFVVNMNQFAFDTINSVEKLDTHCAGVVRCQPFDSYELKQLIMSRHKSSGLSLDFGSGVVDEVSEIKLARIFNAIFDYSGGNPGVAMNAWLTGITGFAEKTINWKTPKLKYKDSVREIPHLWGHLCLQLLLHKRMSLEKMQRTISLEPEKIIEAMQTMRRLQLVLVRGGNIYYLNPGIEFILINDFKEKEWI